MDYNFKLHFAYQTDKGKKLYFHILINYKTINAKVQKINQINCLPNCVYDYLCVDIYIAQTKYKQFLFLIDIINQPKECTLIVIFLKKKSNYKIHNQRTSIFNYVFTLSNLLIRHNILKNLLMYIRL